MFNVLSVEFPSITKIDFPVQQKLAVVQFSVALYGFVNDLRVFRLVPVR